MRNQMKKLNRMGFKTPYPTMYDDILDAEDFLDVLLSEHSKRRNEAQYRIDGVVVCCNSNFIRIESNSNPQTMFAFKKNEKATTRVISVRWDVTRYGRLAPIVQIEPVFILGNEYKELSGVHAKEIKEKQIGAGALVVVSLCGDIIPKITEVIEESEPTFPEFEYYWNGTEVHIYVKNLEDFPDRDILKMDNFLKVLGIKHCGFKTLEKMYENGINTIDKLVRVRVSDLEGIERMGTKSATRIVDEIREGLSRVTWPKIMAASGIFPELVGVERCEAFITRFPNFRFQEITKSEIIEIHGFGDIMADKMIEGLPKFKRWIEKNDLCKPKVIQIKKKEKTFQGQVIVFTGLTATDVLKDEIKARGGIVKDTLVNATTLLVKKNEAYSSNKTQKAEEKGIRIITNEQFLIFLKNSEKKINF